jgi:hypothetical protein
LGSVRFQRRLELGAMRAPVAEHFDDFDPAVERRVRLSVVDHHVVGALHGRRRGRSGDARQGECQQQQQDEGLAHGSVCLSSPEADRARRRPQKKRRRLRSLAGAMIQGL